MRYVLQRFYRFLDFRGNFVLKSLSCLHVSRRVNSKVFEFSEFLRWRENSVCNFIDCHSGRFGVILSGTFLCPAYYLPFLFEFLKILVWSFENDVLLFLSWRCLFWHCSWIFGALSYLVSIKLTNYAMFQLYPVGLLISEGPDPRACHGLRL